MKRTWRTVWIKYGTAGCALFCSPFVLMAQEASPAPQGNGTYRSLSDSKPATQTPALAPSSVAPTTAVPTSAAPAATSPRTPQGAGVRLSIGSPPAPSRPSIESPRTIAGPPVGVSPVGVSPVAGLPMAGPPVAGPPVAGPPVARALPTTPGAPRTVLMPPAGSQPASSPTVVAAAPVRAVENHRIEALPPVREATAIARSSMQPASQQPATSQPIVVAAPPRIERLAAVTSIASDQSTVQVAPLPGQAPSPTILPFDPSRTSVAAHSSAPTVVANSANPTLQTLAAPRFEPLPEIEVASTPDVAPAVQIERLPEALIGNPNQPASAVDAEGPVRFALDYRYGGVPAAPSMTLSRLPLAPLDRYLPQLTPADPSQYLAEDVATAPTWTLMNSAPIATAVPTGITRRQDSVENGGEGLIQAEKEYERFVGSPAAESVFSRLDVRQTLGVQIHENFVDKIPTASEATLASEIRETDGVMWSGNAYGWEAPNFFHRPLYFEEVNLERYGHQRRFVQPIVSGAHFFATVPILPYKMGAHQPNEQQYVLGHYRHGSCVPDRLHRLGWSTRGAIYQGLATSGLVLALP